jgi:hypothetical protein
MQPTKAEKKQNRRDNLGAAIDMYSNFQSLGVSGAIQTSMEANKEVERLEKELKGQEQPYLNQEVDALEAMKKGYEGFMGETLGVAERRAQEGLNTEQEDAIQKDLQAAQSQMLQRASEYGGGLRVAGLSQASNQEGQRELLTLDQQMIQANKQQLVAQQAEYAKAMQGIQASIGEAKGRAEEANEINPYLMKLQQLQDAQNARANFRYSVGQTAANIAGTAASIAI